MNEWFIKDWFSFSVMITKERLIGLVKNDIFQVASAYMLDLDSLGFNVKVLLTVLSGACPQVIDLLLDFVGWLRI